MDISEVYKKLGAISTINCGGCGIAALAMMRLCEKLGIEKDVCIVFLYRPWDLEGVDINMTSLRENKSRLTYVPNHIVLMDKDGKAMDAQEDNPLESYIACHSGVTVKQLLSLINQSNDWNDSFNRERYIPIIEKMLNVDLSDVVS